MAKKKIYFADLTHTAQGISAATFPLGISYIVSYAKKELKDEFDFRLFKFPTDLENALREESPMAMALSNYSWNFELAYTFADLAKKRNNKIVTIFGGPNFPVEEDEKKEFLQKRPAIDFYIELEGELGFVELIHKLMDYQFDDKKLKTHQEEIMNTNYCVDDQLICGPSERIHDVNIIPSPYLSGILDGFFQLPLIPMIETTRGCPFSCTFCADGLTMKNKVHRYDTGRIKDEIGFIAQRVKGVDELIITDLNFAMYQEDIKTAEYISEAQKEYKYPLIIGASAGKNKPKRTIEVAGILNGTWMTGASIQSTDNDVLRAIKRSNISSEAYKELIDYGNNLQNSKTHSEIILCLPADTKEKHYESLRFGMDNNVNSIRMFQAMLLAGTEMASRSTRKEYGLITKFRTIPGCIGIYNFFDEEHPVAEIEEIIVGSDTMPVDDYIDCRIMNLLIETFHNNAVFEEVFSMMRTIGASPFDCVLYVKEHPELYSAKIQEIIKEFIRHTSCDLYDSFEEAKDFVLTPEVIERYIGGELGTNELLLHRALLFGEFEDITNLLFYAVSETLKEKGMLTEKVLNYLNELKLFTVLRKKDIITDTDLKASAKFKYDFEAIGQSNFEIDPNTFEVLDMPCEFRFFHDETQKQHIKNQIELYSNTPVGLGKLIQRSNLKLMYRNFTRDSALRCVNN